MTDIEWRIVDRYVNAIDAHIVRGRLEAEGIPAILCNENLVTMNWLWSQAFGGVVIRVPAMLRTNAIEVIAALDRGEFAQDAGQNVDICAQCGSPLELIRFGLTRELSLTALLLFSLPLPFARSRYRCPQCQ